MQNKITGTQRENGRHVFIIGNAPSQRRFYGIKTHPMIGCNLSIRDFDLDHCVAIDRLAVHEIRKQGLMRDGVEYWCKTSSLELPPGWREFDVPGMDSGSAAIQLAKNLYPGQPIICVGFDGILGIDNSNAYQYPFRPHPTTERIREKHRRSVIEIAQTCDVQFVSIQPHEQLETIHYEDAARIAHWQSRKVSKETVKT